jgi:uncharacterized membrane protein
MASDAQTLPRRPSLRPDRFDQVLAVLSALLLAAVLAALVRGYPHWTEARPLVWTHLITIIVALALTPFLLLQKRGTRRHRQIGWLWSAAMFATAAISFGIHESGPGAFSPIHLLSAVTVIGVPVAVWAARSHRVEWHRRAMRFTVAGALIVAGFFTFPFGRMLGRWLLGGAP